MEYIALKRYLESYEHKHTTPMDQMEADNLDAERVQETEYIVALTKPCWLPTFVSTMAISLIPATEFMSTHPFRNVHQLVGLSSNL